MKNKDIKNKNNKFRDEDLKKLIDTYIEKLNKIRKLI